ncbi:rRNA-processing protein fcf2 [Spatholobus suberectus]|nr:rRNA-processing protein fcf2 [Spatholobus suberectus]
MAKQFGCAMPILLIVEFLVALSLQRNVRVQAVVGLSWQPQLPIPSSLKHTGGFHTKLQTEASGSNGWKSSSELVDGLFVPPSDPRKITEKAS